MRSLTEIRFRLKQEAANLRLLAFPPRFEGREVEAAWPLPGLPAPAGVAGRLRSTPFAAQVERLAEDILAHRYPLLGLRVEAPPPIDWRRDYSTGISTGLRYFRLVPYLDARRSGDHKVVWELNRHQHLVLLAQAWLLTGRRAMLDRIAADLESWWAANPFERGINWASALEAAFRALSWIWVYHLAGNQLEAGVRRRLVSELLRHGAHLENNLSIYFSPNTHLLGEAVALHALGALFPACRHATRWRRLGREIALAGMDRQVLDDGSHFEHSAYYHVYALDLFLLHALLEPPPARYLERLARMGGYLDALLGPGRILARVGDDDGGGTFHPYGSPDHCGRATLAAAAILLERDDWSWTEADLWPQAAWWLGEKAFEARPPAHPPGARSRLFGASGTAVLEAPGVQLLADTRGFGPGGAGHSHSGALSLLARTGAEELLIDPGTYTYVASPEWRNRFRGAAAHNTVRIDGADQAEPAHAFRWNTLPETRVRQWSTSEERDDLDAECRYRGFRHRRRVCFLKQAGLAVVLDEIDGPAGRHRVEQFWHPGVEVAPLGPAVFRLGERAVLVFPEDQPVRLEYGGEHGWRSPAFGVKTAAPVLVAVRDAHLPVRLAAAVDLRGETTRLELRQDAGAIVLRLSGAGTMEIRLDAHGALPRHMR